MIACTSPLGTWISMYWVLKDLVYACSSEGCGWPVGPAASGSSLTTLQCHHHHTPPACPPACPSAHPFCNPPP